MEYQKKANLVDVASNQTSKFRTKNWVEINDESRGTYNVNSQIKFKTTMHISLLKKLLLLITQMLQMLMQIKLIKN